MKEGNFPPAAEYPVCLSPCEGDVPCCTPCSGPVPGARLCLFCPSPSRCPSPHLQFSQSAGAKGHGRTMLGGRELPSPTEALPGRAQRLKVAGTSTGHQAGGSEGGP